MSEHVIDLAELYALGALEPEERDAIDAHALACAACRRALGSAEAIVLALDEAFVPHAEPPALLRARLAASARAIAPLARPRAKRVGTSPLLAAPPWIVAAAAVALALTSAFGFELRRNADLAAALARQDLALVSVVHSHFNHVMLAPRASGAPAAKALYARDGAWVYVVVDAPSCDCRVVLTKAAARRDLGAPLVVGTTASAYVRDADRPDGVELVAASGAVLAAATLVYAAKP